MKLYLLRPKACLKVDDPWDPWYDKCFGFVIRASCEDDARKLAQEHAGDEARGETFDKKKTVWLQPKYTSCEVLSNTGESGIVIQDFHSA
jgi:hypothetical protein